jgi:hypothetical protein
MLSHLMIVAPGKVWLVGEREAELSLADPDGWVEALVEILDGTRTRAAIYRSLAERWPSLSEAAVMGVLGVLEAAGFVGDANVWAYLQPPRWTRHELESTSELAHLAMSG